MFMAGSSTPCSNAEDVICILVETHSITMIPKRVNICRKWWIHENNGTLICRVHEYRQTKSSDGNWSFAWISFRGRSQKSVFTAACRINQVCNGPYCRHDKKAERCTESHVGSWSDHWQGVFLSQMPPLEIKGYSVSKRLLSGPKCFLELFAFKSEYQWCMGIRICTRNKHVWNWNAEYDTCSHRDWKKYVCLVSEIMCLLLRHRDQTPVALTVSTHSKWCCASC